MHDRRREPSVPPRLDDYAIFLDFDGTLADIAPSPWQVRLAPGTLETIGRLSRRVGGALAVISGRQLEDIDILLRGLPQLPAAGIHGAQVRHANGLIVTHGGVAQDIDRVEAELRDVLRPFGGITLERKPVSIAIHYRAEPGREDEVRSVAAHLVRRRPQLRCLHGKKIVEILPSGIDKGQAIGRLMDTVPFAGRIPLFAGDDETDEDGLQAVVDLGGVAIKIGPGPSVAPYGFADAASFRTWLARLAPGLSGEEVP